MPRTPAMLISADQSNTIASSPRPVGPNARALTTPVSALLDKITMFAIVVLAVGPRSPAVVDLDPVPDLRVRGYAVDVEISAIQHASNRCPA